MTPWQRRLRAAIAVFGLAFAALVFFAVRQPKTPQDPGRAVARVDPSAAAESTGGLITQLRGDREDFRVEYDRSLTYGDGRQRLSGVRIFIGKRQGRDFTITSREADVGGDQQSVNLKGDVELKSNDGLQLRAPEASYNQTEGIVRAAGVVAFTSGRLTGTSVGMTYEKDRDVLWLLDQAVLHMAPTKAGGTPIDINAGAAGFARPDRYVRFERGFRLVNAGRVLESDQATAFLSEDESTVEMLEMRGHSRVTGVAETAGALRSMAGQDINLDFLEDGRTLAAATLARETSIEVAGTESGSRRISGGWMDVRMAADGSTLTSLTAREAVRLELPGDAGEPARTVTAASLVSKGENGKGLTSAQFTDNVEFREARPAAGDRRAVARVARSRTLDLAVQPGFGAIDEARFSGAVRFEEDTVRAAAAGARYQVKSGVLELEGTDETVNRMPYVSDERISIEGMRVQLTMEGRKIVATTDVRSAMLRVPDKPAADAAPVKRPSMLKSDQPVQATAAGLTYDGSTKLAVYEGAARLWQGDTAIQGDTVTVDDATGNLSASGQARSTLMLEQIDDTAKTVSRVPTIASADELVYQEQSRRATYTTAAPVAGPDGVIPPLTPNAHVSGPQGDLRAEKIELYLATTGNELLRVEGYTMVTLGLDTRKASGDRLTYFAADKRYLMSGSPVRLESECRETAGRTLTFYRSNDTIVVDGNNQTRTQTRGGGKCVTPPVK